MTSFRNILNAAAIAATLGVAALSATPGSAHGFEHFRHFHHWHSHWGYHFPHEWHSHWRHGYHWGYHFGGYRQIIVEAPRACPAGTHLGYLGKFCWPNR